MDEYEYEYKGKTYYYTIDNEISGGIVIHKYTFYDGDKLIDEFHSILPLLTKQVDESLNKWIKQQRKEKLNELQQFYKNN